MSSLPRVAGRTYYLQNPKIPCLLPFRVEAEALPAVTKQSALSIEARRCPSTEPRKMRNRKPGGHFSLMPGAAQPQFVHEPLGISDLGRNSFLVIPRSFNQSFMFEVLWLIFYFAFGISQVAFYLQGFDGDGRNTAVSFEPSFGQLLSLVLMLLPFLAMAEGYSGKGPLPTSFTFAPRYMD